MLWRHISPPSVAEPDWVVRYGCRWSDIAGGQDQGIFRQGGIAVGVQKVCSP